MDNEIIRGKARIQQDLNGESIIVFLGDFCEKNDIQIGDIYDIDIVNGEIIMTFIERPEVKLRYPIAIYPGDDITAFSVFFPDIPGCFSAGDSLNDAFTNANEALTLHLKGLSDIPTSTSIDDHVNKPEYKGCFWSMTECMK